MWWALLIAGCQDQGLAVINQSPTAAITSHTDGDVLLEGYEVALRGSVTDKDNRPEELTAEWFVSGRSVCPATQPSPEGRVTCTTVLALSDSRISLEVHDRGLAQATAVIDVVVAPTQAPTVEIVRPTNDVGWYAGQLVPFQGVVGDLEDEETSLEVWWESSRDGRLPVATQPDSYGKFIGFGSLTQGEHAITLQVRDSSGRIAVDSVILDVGPPNTPPACTIATPRVNDAVASGAVVSFTAYANDVDIPAEQLSVSWVSDLDGYLGPSTPLATGEIAMQYPGLTTGTHTVTMTVEDEVGARCERTTTFRVVQPPTVQITAPAIGAYVPEGEPLLLSATVADTEDAAPALAVHWSTDVAGLFSTQGATSGGVASLTTAVLPRGTHVLTVTATDTDGLTGSDTRTFSVNGKPSAPGLLIGPGAPTSAQDVTVTIVTPSVDPEGRPVTYRYAWWLDGQPAPAYTSAVLPRAATLRGQTWSVVVTPNDGFVDGDSATAGPVVIQNSPPAVAAPTLGPNPPRYTFDLTCAAGATSDEDQDTVTVRYRWLVDGSVVGGQTTTTLPHRFFAENALVRCEVTPNDGLVDGTMEATQVVVPTNEPPYLGGVSITPSTAYTDDLLFAVPTGWVDADGDLPDYLYQWSVAGVPVSPGGDGPSLDGTHFAKGQVVTVRVTPFDGTETGPPQTSPALQIANSAPAADTVTLSPTQITTVDNVFVTVAGWRDADGDVEGYLYQWLVDGTPAGTASVLDSTAFVRGQAIAVRVTPTDGVTPGTPLLSATTTVANSTPSFEGASISPPTPRTTDTLTALATGWRDDDGDPPVYRYQWFVNGLPVLTGGSGPTLASSQFVKGMSVTVRLTPDDGTSLGDPQTTRAVVVGNSAPGAPTVELSPSNPDADDDVVCVHGADAFDPDSADNLIYSIRWFRNGVEYLDADTTFFEGDTITADVTVSNEEWRCEVTAFDGTTSGPAGSAQATVLSERYGSVTVGNDRSCGLTTDGRIRCWGETTTGSAVNPTGFYDSVSSRYTHTCAVVRGTNALTCWGSNTFNQATAPAGTFASVETGLYHTCAIETDGDVQCWGHTGNSRLAAPATVKFLSLSLGEAHSCGIDTSRNLRCWGLNTSSQAPAMVAGPFSALSAGDNNTCAIDSNGHIQCWGLNDKGQSDPHADAVYVKVHSRGKRTCAVTAAGSLRCWGDNQWSAAVPPSGTFTGVATGNLHTCAVASTGGMWCWGKNHLGQANPP